MVLAAITTNIMLSIGLLLYMLSIITKRYSLITPLHYVMVITHSNTLTLFYIAMVTLDYLNSL